MPKDTMKGAAVAADILLFEDWFDPIEDAVRARVRGFIETMLEEELDAALSRPRYGRRKAGDDDAPPAVVGCRHGHRERTLTGTFGKTRIAVPRARLCEDGKTREWKSQSLRAYQRRTKAADALIAGAYVSGTNTRRVRRALNAVFAGAVSKDARRSRQARAENAGTRHRRRRAGPRKGARGAVAGCRRAALHRAQASQSSRPCA
jgi:transposase-like protein